MDEPKFKENDKVTLYGYGIEGHVYYGIVATVTGSKLFQNESDDSWTWSALIRYKFLGETAENYYPERYLKKYRQYP
jgi:hypothetical protein